MCGIGGKISFTDRPSSGLGEEMTEQMRHRGPDAEDVYANGPAMLAHRRLSILDLSEAGRQPMSNADGSVHIVFNGEIYNYQELRPKVDHYSFRSETDTEVLLHLYEEFGVDCLKLLRGMFAFAIWDERDERLFLARDRLGQKPLFYRDGDESFVFGSTIKSILADEEVEPSPDTEAIRSYLTYQYVPSPQTGFEGIRQLPPASYALFDDDGLRIEQYWSLSYADQFDEEPDHLARRLRDELREATRLRMRSDVPLGVFLSGGLDSTVTTALMSEISDDPVQTYSIGFEVEEYDELSFARTVADHFGTDHHEYVVSPSSTDVLPSLIEQYEMPFGDPSALPTYYVSQVAAQDIKVAMTGDAGDENLAGYDRYTFDKLASTVHRLPRPVRSSMLTAVSELPREAHRVQRVRHAQRFLESANAGPVERYAHFICHALGEDVEDIWNGETPRDELEHLRAAFRSSDGPTRLDRLMNVDMLTYLPDDLLVKADRASMAHSLELRSPFLDHRFVEFSARIPAKYKCRRGEKKWLLKRAFKHQIPDAVVNRSKQGFSVPVSEWFRGELRETIYDAVDGLGARESFDAASLHKRVDDHVDGYRDAGYQLWDLLILERWYRRYID